MKKVIFIALISAIIGIIRPVPVFAQEEHDTMTEAELVTTNEESENSVNELKELYDKGRDRLVLILNGDIPEEDKSTRTKVLEGCNPMNVVDLTLGKLLENKKVPESERTLATDLAKDALGIVPGFGKAGTISEIAIHASKTADANFEKGIQAAICTNKVGDLAISSIPYVGGVGVLVKNICSSYLKYGIKKAIGL